MQSNTYLTRAVQQAHGAFSPPSTSLPQPPKTRAPLKGTFFTAVYQGPHATYSASSTPPTSNPITKNDTTKDQHFITYSSGPAQYTLGNGPREAPGTVAYYKSWTFRKKVNTGTTQVPGQAVEAGKDIDDSADEDCDRKSKKADQAISLVIVFSRTNARRANAQRKRNKRMQKEVLEESGRRKVFL